MRKVGKLHAFFMNKLALSCLAAGTLLFPDTSFATERCSPYRISLRLSTKVSQIIANIYTGTYCSDGTRHTFKTDSYHIQEPIQEGQIYRFNSCVDKIVLDIGKKHISTKQKQGMVNFIEDAEYLLPAIQEKCYKQVFEDTK